MTEGKWDKVGIVVQSIAGCVVGIGIGLELAMGADLGFVLITLGSLLYAIGTKLRKI